MEAYVLIAESGLKSSDSPMENKIIPFSSLQENGSLLEKHLHALTKCVDKVFGKELFTDAALSDKLPLVKWSECDKVPGAFQIYLLSSAHRKHEIHLFFHEMVSHWLVSGDQLNILSSRNLTFQLRQKNNRAFYFIELLVHVENEKQLELVRKNLPGLGYEIKLGAFSKGYARHILEMKRLSLGGKTSYIYETIVSAMRRYPKILEHDIFREIQRFLLHCKEEFREIRDMRHLCRIILSHYLFHKAIGNDVKHAPERRHLYVKLLKTHLHYPFGLKKVVGLAITFNSVREYECFEERHILKAIQRILPGIVAIRDSFYSHRHDENKTLSLYLEIEKDDGKDFSLNELITLRQKLQNELKNSIEYLSPSLFIPRNEEELYRNIIALSQELKYVGDLPQAIISFQEQSHDLLKFNIILLRLLHKDSLSLQELSRHLSVQERFVLERVTSVGTLRKKYVKEACVFSIEIESRLFLRKNHSVDLIRARQSIVQAVEKLVGGFRDYNGGFLLKQNEQLESIKREWGEEAKLHEFLIENLFYSLTPSIMQTLIPPPAGKLLGNLFLKTVEQPLAKQAAHLLERERGGNSFACVIKARAPVIREQIGASLKALEIDPLKLASALVEHEGLYYLCYLYLEPTENEMVSFLDTIQQTLKGVAGQKLDTQTVRLILPHATHSLDPRVGADRTSGIVIKMLYEGLMRTGSNGQLECAIAEKVEISPDKRRYTFTLKETKWSNGVPLTAYDFEYAWKKILEPDFRSTYSFLLFIVKNAEKAKSGEIPLSEVGIRAVDKKTLVVDLEYPAAHFLDLTSHWTYSPLCCEIDQRHPGWAYQNASTHVSNGPFKLDVWKLNDDLAVTKNPLYWDAESVKLGRIELTIMGDRNAFEMFRRGELDWYGDPIRKIPFKECFSFQESKELLHSPQEGFFWLQINLDDPLFSTAKLRKAFAYAINRKFLIQQILKRDDDPALRFNNEKAKRASPLFPDGDVKLAVKLFEEGLLEIGLTRDKLAPLIVTHSDINEHVALSQEIGRQWEQALGIKVKYERLPWNHYFDALHKRHDFMVGGLSWYSRYEDPLYYLDLLIPRAGTPTVTHWKNPKYSQLIESAKHEIDKVKRGKMIDEAEVLVLEEMPLIPIFFDKWRYVKNPRLKGVILSTIGQIDFREAYLEK